MSGGASVEEFRAAAERFLAERLLRRVVRQASDWGAGDDRITLLEEMDPELEHATLEQARRWQAELYEVGYGWITGPAELGGAGLTREYQAAFAELLGEYVAPDPRPLTVGLNIVAPAVLAHGSAQLRRRALPALHRGDLVACQLFSEPEAGSDLAAVRTTARRAGDGWVLNGHKIWSSGAHLADVGEILVRTDPDAPRHRGLTMFLLDMHDPGVRVSPIRQMTGGASFNEVFLDDVPVRDADRIGEVGAGWKVALTSLTSERSALGAGDPLPADFVPRLRQLVTALPEADDPVVRQLSARALVAADLLRLTGERYAEERRAGRPELGGVEGSVTKLLLVRCLAETERLLTELLGMTLVADDGEWGRYCWSEFVLGAPAFSIAGGTDDIQRNLIAERGLGLPREGRTP